MLCSTRQMHLHFFQQHVKKQTSLLSTILVPQGKKQARKCPFYQALRAFENYSNSQSSICFMVLPQCFSFNTVHFRTVFHVFTMFLSDCIVILLSTICYTLKSTNNLKYYNIHKALPFPYKLEVIYFSSSLRPSSLHITCYP